MPLELPDAPPAHMEQAAPVKAFSLSAGVGLRYSFRRDQLGIVPFTVLTYRVPGNRIQPAIVAAYNVQSREWSLAGNVGFVAARWGSAR